MKFYALYALIKPDNNKVIKIGQSFKHPDILTNNSYSYRYNEDGYVLVGYWPGKYFFRSETVVHNHNLLSKDRIYKKNGKGTEWFKTTLSVINEVISKISSTYKYIPSYDTLLSITKSLLLDKFIYNITIYDINDYNKPDIVENLINENKYLKSKVKKLKTKNTVTVIGKIIDDNILYTMDRFFYVVISSIKNEILACINEQLITKFVKMCGINGRKLFPNNLEYS